MITDKHKERALELIKKLSPTMVVRELITVDPLAGVELDGVEILEPLTQEEAETVVFEALESQRKLALKFQVSKETMIERYYDLYYRAVEQKDIKAAKTILDKLLSESGLSVDTEITTSGTDKIILKIE